MICIIAAAFPPEPVVSASIAYDLATELAKFSKVVVLTPRPSRPYGVHYPGFSEGTESFERIVLRSFTYPKPRLLGRLMESYSLGRHASDYLKRNRTAISSVYLNVWPLFAQYDIVKTCRRYSIPCIIHVQDIYPESLLGKVRIIDKLLVSLLVPLDAWILRNSSKIIVISRLMREYLKRTRGLADHNIQYIPNWQDERRFLGDQHNFNSSVHNKNEFTFMFLGSLNITAAVDHIINAFALASIEHARLVIAGNGSEKDRLIKLAGTFKNVNIEFCDARSYDVPYLQSSADVLLLNLRRNAARYALPSKLIAYMYSKKPIIACVDEESDSAMTVRDSGCGWIVEPENVHALSDAMRTAVLSGEDELKAKGRNGFEFAMTYFSRIVNLKAITGTIAQASQLSIYKITV